MVYVGMGEACIRGNASPGDGVYKSTDAGRTWKNVGLKDTQQIGKVLVNPQRSEYRFRRRARAISSRPNEQRGVFRSTDGGATWKQVLTRGPKAGAVDLSMDPANPNVIYAAFWEVYRTPYSASKAAARAADSGNRPTAARHGRIFRTNPGMPKGLMGRVGVAVSPANPHRVYALIEAEEGGALQAPITAAIPGSASTRTTTFASAPGITRTSSPIPKIADTVYYLNTGFYALH